MSINGVSKIDTKKIALIFVLAGVLVLSAGCSGTTANSSSPSSTTVMETLPPVEQPTDAQPIILTEDPSTGGNLDICSLVTTADVEAVLGQSVISVTPGSEPDAASGATLYSCTYLGNGIALIISSADIGSAQTASDMMDTQFETMKSYQPDTILVEESGVGDKIFWTVRENAVAYNVLKGSHLIGVAIGGSIGDPALYKAGLLHLTELVVAAQ